tara:strand:- start:401 stop:1165 length:765 start_codon:yes stop_codon:yes gene_type:complete
MKNRFTILGCGSSLGVPRIDGFFGSCDPNNIKNYRSRCSALLTINKKNILFDTSPDLKSQLLNNKINNIDYVFYTHSHADQTHGINELRVFFLKNKKKIPTYADTNTKKYLLKSFNYCFNDSYDYPATLKLKNLKNKNIINKNIDVQGVLVKHGSIESVAYIINSKCAYAPDVNKIYNKDLQKFKNLDYFVVDCLRYKYHPSHFNLENVLDLVKIIQPKKTILTNLHNDIDYLKIKKILPRNIIPAYDGMSFNI